MNRQLIKCSTHQHRRYKSRKTRKRAMASRTHGRLPLETAATAPKRNDSFGIAAVAALAQILMRNQGRRG